MPEPTTTLVLPDDRVLAADDVGDPAGWPVVYVHGSPDTRLARHPDDEVATRLGVRLVAVDRPGFGGSSADPASTAATFGADVALLLAALEIERVSVLAWSAGALGALGITAALGDRVEITGIAAGLPPFAAYAAPGVLDGADDGRRMLAEMGAEMGAAGVAELLAPYLVPDPPTLAAAREHLLEGADPVRRAELESVPGAVEAMCAAMVDAVRQGLAGISRDIELQVLPPDIDLAHITTPVTLWYGTADTTAPPAFGRWYAQHLPAATLEVLDGAGHCFPLPRWSTLLTALKPPVL